MLVQTGHKIQVWLFQLISSMFDSVFYSFIDFFECSATFSEQKYMEISKVISKAKFWSRLVSPLFLTMENTNMDIEGLIILSRYWLFTIYLLKSSIKVTYCSK